MVKTRRVTQAYLDSLPISKKIKIEEEELIIPAEIQVSPLPKKWYEPPSVDPPAFIGPANFEDYLYAIHETRRANWRIYYGQIGTIDIAYPIVSLKQFIPSEPPSVPGVSTIEELQNEFQISIDTNGSISEYKANVVRENYQVLFPAYPTAKVPSGIDIVWQAFDF